IPGTGRDPAFDAARRTQVRGYRRRGPRVSCAPPRSLLRGTIPPSPLRLKTAILGAGVSGLALAQFLVEAGVPRGDLVLFEAAPVAGGLCGSKTVDGFTYDVAGGHILFSKDRPAMDWMKRQTGGDDAFVERRRETKIRFG